MEGLGLLLLSLHDFGEVDFDPVGKGFDVFADAFAEWGESVIDVGRDDGVDGAIDEAVALQLLKGLREHFFADATDPAAEVGKAKSALAEGDENQYAPASGHVFEDVSRRTRDGEDLTAFHRRG